MTRTIITSAITLVLTSAGCSYPRVDLGDLDSSYGGDGSVGGAGGTSTGGASQAIVGGSTAVVGGASPGGSTTAPGDRKVAQVAVGWYHLCALLTDSSVYCWGGNYGGQLGDGTTADSLQPTLVQGLSGIPVSIDADYTDSCAVRADGTMQCWGSNYYGQLGDGTRIERHLPTDVVIGPVRQLSLGEYHTCALMPNSTVSCWGNNFDNQLGPSAGADSLTPLTMAGTANATQVSAGANVTCALLADQSVSCWGAYGDDICSKVNVSHATPSVVTGVSNVIRVSTGGGHACALIGDGSVMCWGSNSHSQIGEGASSSADCVAEKSSPPATVPGLSDVSEVASGYSHTCALLTNGQVACWGANEAGQLGDGTTTEHANATLVIGVSNAVHISSGYAQTCAVISNGSLMCWGNFGGYPDIGPRPIATPVNF